MRVPGDRGAPVEMDPDQRGFEIDFRAAKVTSAFVEETADIIDRNHYRSEGAGHNVLIARWGSGDYPMVITEQNGSFWDLAGSGTLGPGDEVWLAMYECVPAGTGS